MRKSREGLLVWPKLRLTADVYLHIAKGRLKGEKSASRLKIHGIEASKQCMTTLLWIKARAEGDCFWFTSPYNQKLVLQGNKVVSPLVRVMNQRASQAKGSALSGGGNRAPKQCSSNH